MQNQEVPEETTRHEPVLPWIPPMPVLSPKDRIALFFERFGFLMAALGTALVLLVLFLNADLLLSEPNEEEVAASPTPPLVVESLPVQPISENVILALATLPTGATIFIDGDSVGVSPLEGFSLPAGPHRLLIQKEAHTSLDTLVELANQAAALYFTLETTTPDLPTESTDLAQLPTTTQERVPPDRVTTPPANARQNPAQPAATPRQEEAEEEEVPAKAVMGKMRVSSQPSGASVWVDGEMVGKTPLLLENMAIGSKKLDMRLEGYKDHTAQVTLADGQTTQVNALLEAFPGTLKILVKPWGNIYIDGRLHKEGADVWYTVELKAGTHKVRIEHPSLGKWENNVVVPPGKVKEEVINFNQ